MPRLILAVTALLVLATSAVAASAATLGGLSTPDLGAAEGTVASHLNGISVDLAPVWENGWTLDGLTLATPGKDGFHPAEVVSVALVDSNGKPMCELTTTSPDQLSSLVITRPEINKFCGGPVSMDSIARVAVVAGT